MGVNELRAAFAAKFGGEARIFRAPGRVNLIGEHTDYNEGFVMPCAIEFATLVAAAPRRDRMFRITSRNFDGDFAFDLDNQAIETGSSWARYVEGVASILDRQGFTLRGADVMIESDVPIGAGLSSSAALEVATGFALSSVSGYEIDKWLLARTGQAAEHEYAGVRSGIMDQFASAFGTEGHALFLDCRSFEWEAIPLGGARFLICNTKTKHDLADGEYNKRRADCEEAARILGRKSLRDVTPAELDRRQSDLPEQLCRRARHIVGENERVLEAVAALKAGELPRFGELMDASHVSLRDDYDVSCRELDVMVEIARRQQGVLGSRMTGGGFGGCTINLLGDDAPADLAEKIAAEYRRTTSIEPEIYAFRAAAGISEIG